MFLSWTFFLCCISGLKAVPLLLSMTTSIKILDESNTSNISDVTKTNTLAISVDYHYNRGEIYYSNDKGKIFRLKRKEDTAIIIAEVTQCDGLAVDWVSDNLYWTDVEAHKVEMATLDGLYRRTLFDTSHGVEKPRAIVLDPSKGLMFWSDWGKNAKIESSGLDGHKKMTIVSSDLFWPNGLSLDLRNKKLYILDGYLSTISSCNYDGTDLKVIKTSRDTLQQAFALTLYGNTLYWGSRRQHTLFSMDVGSGNTQSLYKRKGAMMKERMMGLRVMDPTLQSPSSTPNPCQSAGCSHRCLVSRTLSATCICPYGFTLQSDNKTCVEKGYLLTSWRKTILRCTLQGSNEDALIKNTAAVISIDYHLKKNFIFWSNIDEHRIYRAPLGQLNNKTVVAVAEQCDGLAVDWLHDVIYWTDTHNNTLEAAKLDGSNRKTIFSDHLDEPRAIVVDPHSRYIFWSDWGSSPKLERAVLDGSDRQTIVSSDIYWPNGMTLDLDKKIIYWVDGKLNTISSCNYNGANRSSLLGPTKISFLPFAITSFQDKLYWTDWVTQSLFQINKGSVNELTILANHSTTIQMRPYGVKVVHSSLQPEGQNSCEYIRCRDICLGSANPQRGHCMGELEEEEEDYIDVRIGEIKSVAVYKMSANTIYFRCQVQNRTMKQLEKFVGNYSMSGSSVSQTFEAVAKPCIVWPEYYCFNVSGLGEEIVYNFNISSALRDKRVGDHIEVSAFIKKKASGPPEDIKITSYTPTSVILEWRYPNMSNGIIRNFIINVNLVKMFKEEKCHLSPLPIFQSPAEDEQDMYIHEVTGLCPASSYAISISAMNEYLGVPAIIDVNTPPSPMDITRQPSVQLSSLPALSWKPTLHPPTDLPQYNALIKSYLLLMLSTIGDNQSGSNFDSLHTILKSQIGSEFKVLWYKRNDDEEAFKQPIKVENLEPRKQYQLAWVQVSQYNDAYGIDYILSDHFIAL